MALDKSISFTTERFDYTSELPSECNAGNRFYGRDVAAFLCEQLATRGFEAACLDEDWGWLVLGKVTPSLDYEIATYNLNDHGQGGRPGASKWGLWIRAFERTKILGVLPRRRQVAVPGAVLDGVLEAIVSIGATAHDWAGGQGA